MPTTTIVNWDRTQSWTPEAVHAPTSEAEVASLVRQAAEQGRQLKPVGGALSWSDIIDMPGQAMRFPALDRVIRYAGTIPRHQETEYAVPRPRAAEAIEATRQLVLKGDFRVNFPMEVRFVAADDIALSPASGRDCCYVGAYVGSLEWAPGYFAGFEELVSDYEGRPHWGKTFTRTPTELRALYPGYDAFDALRRRCDPEGVFRNRFVDRVFAAED